MSKKSEVLPALAMLSSVTLALSKKTDELVALTEMIDRVSEALADEYGISIYEYHPLFNRKTKHVRRAR
jgi:hypothetical protein